MAYCLGSNGDLVCLSTADGKQQWRKDLRKDFGGKPGKWAYAESPLVDGEVLVVAPGGSKATIVALHKKSGDTVWESASPEGDEAAYASAMIVDAGGLKQYVEFLSKGLVGVEAKTGKLLWRYEKTSQNSPAYIPTPLIQDQFVYSAAGRSGGGLVQLKVAGSTVEAERPISPPSCQPPLEEPWYSTEISMEPMAGLPCAARRMVKPGGRPRRWRRSLCYADGRLYVHGENGEVALEATSKPIAKRPSLLNFPRKARQLGPILSSLMAGSTSGKWDGLVL
jgi:hypothetical protein